MVAGKSFNGKFTAKIDFPIGYFMLPLLMLTLEVLEDSSLKVQLIDIMNLGPEILSFLTFNFYILQPITTFDFEFTTTNKFMFP